MLPWRGEVPPLIQPEITRAKIEELVQSPPRRHRLRERKALKPPSEPGNDPRLSFPFRETFQNLARSCPVPLVLRDGSPREDGRRGNLYSYLKCDAERIPDIERWLETFSAYVVCRDLLAVSMALDYDREGGAPQNPQTNAALLRRRAKPYDGPATSDCYAAASHLAGLLLELVTNVEPYSETSLIVPMPPSSPGRPYDLPRVLVQHLAERWHRPDGSAAITAIAERAQLKNLSLHEKLDTLEGSFIVDPWAVNDRVVLLVDDLYQSGASMNFVAMKLIEAGAKAVLGLAVEKTCRNDDNRGRP